jgi:inosose dehydratase
MTTTPGPLPFDRRLAGAPICWGVCEAPGWGYEQPADLVLAQMRDQGLTATELGPTGYLGDGPAAVRDRLDRVGMRLIGGFLPVPMHVDRALDLTEAEAAITTLAQSGSEVVVLAARSADGSYERKVRLDPAEWALLLITLGRLQELAGRHGLLATLHPHVGTAIEDRDSVLRLLDTSDIPLCLDTGHLLIGGTDPLELVSQAAGRVRHVHLKDVRASIATEVAAERMGYLDAVRAGLYTPLGGGDLEIGAIIAALEGVGYQGWYVLEQDCSLDGPPAPGQGPVLDVQRSLDHLAGVTRPHPSQTAPV